MPLDLRPRSGRGSPSLFLRQSILSLSLILVSCGEESRPRADQVVCPIGEPTTLNFRVKDAIIDIEDGSWKILIDPPSNLGCYVGLVIYVGRNFSSACSNDTEATAKGIAYCSLCNGDPNYVILRASEISCGQR